MTDEVMAAWAKAFVTAQSEMPDIPKSKTATIPTKNGESYEYKYADLPAIIDAVRPVLSNHGLAFAQSVETTDAKEIAITTRIFHIDGGVQSFGPLLLPGGNDARGAGSAITYARRYALCAALGIAADEDDDAATAPTRKASGGGSATGNGAGPVEESGRSSPPSPDDPPLAGDRPCPHCGHEVNPVTSSNTKAPKWKCSNETCTGSYNKGRDNYEPWVSWHENPWKSGGEVEAIIQASSPETSVTGGGDQAATAKADTNGTAPSDGQESSPGSEPSTRRGPIQFSLLEQAWEGGVITLGDAIKASMGPCGRGKVVAPSTKKEFAKLPDSILAEIVEHLKLEQRLPV